MRGARSREGGESWRTRPCKLAIPPSTAREDTYQTGTDTNVQARLKLKVYRSLGIEVESDGAGGYNKAIIRNARKGDLHVVNIDPKFSRFFYANYLWQTM